MRMKMGRAKMRIARALIWLLLALVGPIASPVAAQEASFAAVMIVNDRVISGYELNQRMLFMRLLQPNTDIAKASMDGLIDDRLRLYAADLAGLKATPEAVQAGMEEFASRANLTAEKFLAAIAQGGVEPQTFRDFVEAGLIWRDVVRAKFAPGVTITETEIDRAIAAGAAAGGEIRALLSEIVIPTDGDAAAALALAEKLRAGIGSEAGFAEAARRYSAAPTAARGGRMEWVPLANLPADVAARVLGLTPGQISAPVSVPGSVVIFQLRDIAQGAGEAPSEKALDYAQFLLSGDATELARVRASVERCDDLYALAKGLPEDRLSRETLPASQVPADIALELAKLDAGESSVALTRGGWRVFLMLCSRNPVSDVPPSRGEIRAQLLNQRLGALAEGYLEELRSEAILKQP